MPQDSLKTALRAAELGREVLLHYFGHLKHVREKAQAGLVSEADLQSEKVITDFLRKNTPKVGILGEEEAYKREHKKGRAQNVKHDARWIIDPLDGTTNYVHGFPVFCISIGLEVKGELKVGVVDVPILKTTYYGSQGKGAFCNGKKLQASRKTKISQSLLATGFNSLRKRELVEQLKIFSRLIAKARGLRRAGAAAYDLCLVAEGVFDSFWEYNLKPWDTAAGVLLVREAGGKVTDYSGAEFQLHHPSLVASGAPLHPSILREIRSALKSSPATQVLSK